MPIPLFCAAERWLPGQATPGGESPFDTSFGSPLYVPTPTSFQACREISRRSGPRRVPHLGTFRALSTRIPYETHLAHTVQWTNVPERVWDYTLGGYQVLKKWLSYRETLVLGRTLKADEARTFSQIARRIAAILLMEEDLDASYRRCSAETWDWPAAVEAAKPQRPLFGNVTAR